MPSVLVTGANGFLAVHITQILLDKGYDVVGTVRSESKTPYLRERFKTDRLQFAI
ncbi:methylglyoxal reductase (NADPH-dependent) gre2, partial [Tulasnella sp. 403]